MERISIDFAKIEKQIRAEVIKDYMEKFGIKNAICFSCGNASRYLKKVGVPLLDVSPNGDFNPNRWFTPGEIRNIFPNYFDATSGHLPIFLMTEISNRLKQELHLDKNRKYIVPTGSGETVICLKMAFKDILFIPQYNNANPATEYNEEAPLNLIVETMFDQILIKT